jgi:hypothetical protein
MSDDETRIADLENEIKHRDRRILELKRDLDDRSPQGQAVAAHPPRRTVSPAADGITAEAGAAWRSPHF